MGRKIKVSAAVINLRIHPHSAPRYVELFRSVYKLKVLAKVHGDRNGMISSISFRDQDEGVLSGVITTFTDLPLDGTWFDTDELDEASDEKLSDLSIPSGIFPNAATYFFRFTTADHRLYVETYSRGKSITPRSVLKLIRGLFSHSKVVEEFGQPSISLVQDKDGLVALFSIDRIKKIEITIEKPNTDILDDNFEEDIEKHLLETRAQKLTLVYEAIPGKSLVPSKDIQRAGQVALTNGDVKVTGRNEGMAFSASTSEYPKVLRGKYDPEVTSEQQAFTRLIQNQNDQ